MCFDLLDCVDWADENIEKLGALLAKKNNLDDFMPTCNRHAVSILFSNIDFNKRRLNFLFNFLF